MAHWSENAARLNVTTSVLLAFEEAEPLFESSEPAVYLFRFPAGRTDEDAERSTGFFHRFADACERLHPESVVCILTTPPDAARLLPFLEKALRFQLWVAVKKVTPPGTSEGQLPSKHSALLVLTRYRSSLRHTKTRIQYTYCPACMKTTKDYGGKKHGYHEYGTLMSDVWRDIEVDPAGDIEPVVTRLSDLFGVPPYSTLYLIDLQHCKDLLVQHAPAGVAEPRLPFSDGSPSYPLESRLINADCLEAIREIPDSSVDFCFADPPYNLRNKYDHWNDDIDSIRYFEWCDQWLGEMERHAQIMRGEDPFAKRDEIPAAKNSPVPRLPKQRYVVTKKALQLEVKRIAQILGRLPSREEVNRLGRYPLELYDKYFISWGEACAAARTTGMSELPPEYGDKSFQFRFNFDE